MLSVNVCFWQIKEESEFCVWVSTLRTGARIPGTMVRYLRDKVIQNASQDILTEHDWVLVMLVELGILQ